MNIRKKSKRWKLKFRTLGGLFDLEGLEELISENEMKMAEPGFWDDQTKAQTVINENNELKAKYDNFHQLATAVEELEVLYELVQEAPEAEMLTELAETYAMTKQKLESYQLTLLLNEPYDKDDAILEIHPGAGGTESQDWGSMRRSAKFYPK